MLNLIKKMVLWLWRLVKTLYLDPVKEAFIDLRELSPSMKILVVLGYVAVFLLLLMTLVFEFFGQRMPMAQFTSVRDGVDVLQQVPVPAVVVCSLGLLLGWAYLLTGATDCRRRVLLPLMALFALQLLFIMPTAGWETGQTETPMLLVLPFCGFAPLLLLGVIVLHFFTHQKRIWRDVPLLEIGFWLGVMCFYLVGLWLIAPDRAGVVKALNGSFSVLALLAVPWWLLSGLTMIHATLGFGRKVAVTLRRVLPGGLLRVFALFVALAHPTALWLAVALNTRIEGNSPVFMVMMLNGLLALPLALTMLVLMVARRWSPKNAARLLTLSFASPAFSLAVVLAFSGVELTDVMGFTVESVGDVSPILVFVALMAYNVLSMGAAFANEGGEIMPRDGRILMGFGASLLVITFTIFFVNSRDAASGRLDEGLQMATSAFFSLGVIVLGLPYLAITTWKQRAMLAGDEALFEDMVPVLTTVEASLGRVGLVVLTVAAVLGACLLCFLSMLLVQPLST